MDMYIYIIPSSTDKMTTIIVMSLVLQKWDHKLKYWMNKTVGFILCRRQCLWKSGWTADFRVRQEHFKCVAGVNVARRDTSLDSKWLRTTVHTVCVCVDPHGHVTPPQEGKQTEQGPVCAGGSPHCLLTSGKRRLIVMGLHSWKDRRLHNRNMGNPRRPEHMRQKYIPVSPVTHTVENKKEFIPVLAINPF